MVRQMSIRSSYLDSNDILVSAPVLETVMRSAATRVLNSEPDLTHWDTVSPSPADGIVTASKLTLTTCVRSLETATAAKRVPPVRKLFSRHSTKVWVKMAKLSTFSGISLVSSFLSMMSHLIFSRAKSSGPQNSLMIHAVELSALSTRSSWPLSRQRSGGSLSSKVRARARLLPFGAKQRKLL